MNQSFDIVEAESWARRWAGKTFSPVVKRTSPDMPPLKHDMLSVAFLTPPSTARRMFARSAISRTPFP